MDRAQIDEALTAAEKARVVEGLLPISGRETRPRTWRPLEVTIVAQPEVRPWRSDVDLTSLPQPADHTSLLRRELAPGGDRIGLVEHTGRLQEGGELIGRHVRVLGVSGGREDGGRPAAFASRGTREGCLS